MNRQGYKPVSNVSLRQLTHFCRKLNLKPKSILAFQDGVITYEGLKDLSRSMGEAGIKEVVLLVVKDINDIANLDEATMNKYGWFHLPQLMKKLKVEEQPPEQEQEKSVTLEYKADD